MSPRVFAPYREIRRITRQPVSFALAFLLALGGSFFAVRLFLDFDFYFGSVFSLFLFLRFGPLSAGIAAILGTVPVALASGALWVPLFAVAEILVLALLPVRKKGEYLVPLDALFWVVGSFVLMFVLLPKWGAGIEVPLLFVLNRFINGIANAVLATILHTVAGNGREMRPLGEHTFSYRSVIYISMIAFVLVPSLFTLVLTINREVAALERRIGERIDLVLRGADQAATLRLRDYEHAVRTLARAAQLNNTLKGEVLSMELRFLYQADRWIRFAGTWDRNGELLLAYGDRRTAESLNAHEISELETDSMPLTLVRLETEEPAESMARFGILILVPVRDEEEAVGGVGMVVNAELLGHLLSDLSDGWWVTSAILDDGNRVIGASKPGIDALATLDEPLIPLNGKGLDTAGTLAVPWKEEGETIGSSPYEESRSFSYKPSWRIIADTNLAPFRDELRGEALRSLTIVVSVLITAMGLAAVVSASLVRSLGKLHRLTDTLPGTMEDEGREREWPKSRIKEISALIRRFKHNLHVMSEAFHALRQTNERLAEASDDAKTASRAKSAFLANVSHELRTPLNAVLGYAQYLQSEPELKDEYREPVSTIRTSAEQLLEMIDDILEVSRLRNQSIEEKWDIFDLRSLLDHIAKPFAVEAEAAGLDPKVELDESVPHFVQADQKHLRRIVTNLLDNAIKFTETGTVTLEAAMAGEERLRLTVADTGIGISESQLTQIFSPFHQQEETLTKRRSGTGLGLAIVQHLVTLMRGTIEASSTPGMGTTFTLELPIMVVGSGGKAPEREQGERPRPEFIRALSEVAKSGDIVHLNSVLEELRTEDPRGAAFYDRAIALVDAFELEQLKELLKQYEDG